MQRSNEDRALKVLKLDCNGTLVTEGKRLKVARIRRHEATGEDLGPVLGYPVTHAVQHRHSHPHTRSTLYCFSTEREQLPIHTRTPT